MGISAILGSLIQPWLWTCIDSRQACKRSSTRPWRWWIQFRLSIRITWGTHWNSDSIWTFLNPPGNCHLQWEWELAHVTITGRASSYICATRGLTWVTMGRKPPVSVKVPLLRPFHQWLLKLWNTSECTGCALKSPGLYLKKIKSESFGSGPRRFPQAAQPENQCLLCLCNPWFFYVLQFGGWSRIVKHIKNFEGIPRLCYHKLEYNMVTPWDSYLKNQW
jgi:hypothetical protein